MFGSSSDEISTAIDPRECELQGEFALVGRAREYLAHLGAGRDPGAILRAAWEEFYRLYAPVVRREARSRRRGSGDPDDATQEVWRAVVTKLDRFALDPGRGRFRAWIVVVARRRLADWERREARWARLGLGDQALAEIAGREEDPAVSHERQVERDRARSLLDELSGRVSPLSYRVLLMRSIEGRTVADVAVVLGLTADQVRARHHRMVGKLRDLHDGREGERSTSVRAARRKS